MERIGEDVRRELGRHGPQGAMPEVLAAWPEAVGAMVAANAWPARIARDGTLHVNTSSSSWAFELAQLAPEILGRLQDPLGASAPKAIRFAVGHLPEAAPPDSVDRRRDVPEPDEEALQRAAELTAGIDDEELRKRVARAVSLGLARPPSDHSF